MPRLFIGIPLPDNYKKRIGALTRALDKQLHSKVKWTRAENAHLTLKFLGQVEEERVGAIRRALSDIEFPGFSLAAGECGCFPNQRKPRVIWTGLRLGAEECKELASAVDKALADVGFEREDREFQSHLTLGRVKRLGQDDWETALQNGDSQWPEIEVGSFVLWESELTHEGPIYTVVDEFFLFAKR